MLGDFFNTTFFFIITILCFITCFNYGYITNLIINSNENSDYKNSTIFIFVGFGVLISLISLINFFYKINYLVFIFLNISNIIFIIKIYSLRKNLIKFLSENYKIFFLLLIISKISMITYFASDTGYYHLPLIKLITEQKTVFGLGNIFHQFGFNNSNNFFSAFAMISPFFNRGFAIPSVLIFFCTILYLYNNRHKFNNYFYFLILLSSHFFYNFKNIGSASPDFFVNCYAIIIFCEIFFLINKKNTFYIKLNIIKNLLLLLLSILILKFSTGFFVTMIGIFLIIFYKNYLIKAFTSKFLFIASFILVTFFFKNVALTGYPFYPLGLFFIETFWTVPSSLVTEIFNIVTLFAKKSGDPNFKIEGLNWIAYWIKSNDKTYTLSIIISFLLLFSNILAKQSEYGKINKKQKWILSFYFSSLIFWFFTAPDLRFGLMLNVFIFLTVLDLNLIYKTKINNIFNKVSKFVFIIIVFYSVIYLNVINIYLNWNKSFYYNDGWRQIITKNKIINHTKKNNYNFIEMNGFCWYSEYFCRSSGSGINLENINVKKILFQNIVIFNN